MSTRSTVIHEKDSQGNGWHLYRELDGDLYLEIVEGPFLFTGKVPEDLAKIIEEGLKK